MGGPTGCTRCGIVLYATDHDGDDIVDVNDIVDIVATADIGVQTDSTAGAPSGPAYWRRVQNWRQIKFFRRMLIGPFFEDFIFGMEDGGNCNS